MYLVPSALSFGSTMPFQGFTYVGDNVLKPPKNLLGTAFQDITESEDAPCRAWRALHPKGQ